MLWSSLYLRLLVEKKELESKHRDQSGEWGRKSSLFGISWPDAPDSLNPDHHRSAACELLLISEPGDEVTVYQPT